MSESPPLPTTYGADLGPADLDVLFEDLGRAADVLAVRCDGDGDVTLPAALAGLQGGTVRRVQVRYRHGPDVWCDTLMARTDGARLVRMRIEDES